MNLVGTILVGPNEETLEIALQSFKRCNVDAIHALIDTERSENSPYMGRRDEIYRLSCYTFSEPVSDASRKDWLESVEGETGQDTD